MGAELAAAIAPAEGGIAATRAGIPGEGSEDRS
jgi:hypothetical protein